MELKVFRDILYAGGGCCTVKAEIPVETEILISDYLPQVFRSSMFCPPGGLAEAAAAGQAVAGRVHRCTVYYQGRTGRGCARPNRRSPSAKRWTCRSLPFLLERGGGGGDRVHQLPGGEPPRIEVRGAYGLVASVNTQCSTEAITALADCGIQQRRPPSGG